MTTPSLERTSSQAVSDEKSVEPAVVSAWK
jgi:hypothetical protein